MNNRNTFVSHLWKGAIVLALLVLLIHLAPQETSSFKYYFEVGKPWGYELVTAEFDFPIYKTEAQLKQEEAEVMRDFSPYYMLDESVAGEQVSRLFHNVNGLVTETSYDTIVALMRRVYANGIINATEKEQWQKQLSSQVSLIDEARQATLIPLDKLPTPRQAYAEILSAATLTTQGNIKRLNASLYIVPNLVYDTLLSEQRRSDLINSISPTEGMVQKGEKIIDRGEVVTPELYQILTSLSRAYTEKDMHYKNVYSMTAEAVLMLYLLAMIIVYLLVFRPNVYNQSRNVLFFALLIAIEACLTYAILSYTSLSVYVVPYIWVPVLIRVFYDSRTALYMHIVTVLLISLIVPAPYEFVLIQLGVGMVAIGSLKDISQRSQLGRTAIYVVIAYSLLYTAQCLAAAGDWHQINRWMYVYFLINGLLVVAVYGLVFVIERLFGFVSSITLVELTNVNSSLMLEFAEKAPGTFQHSLQVSTLATEAAKRIGADALLVRTGALYHDIGKLANPQYFTENQQNGVNPLSEMSCEQAAQAVIAHVTDGVRLAEKNNLPKVIVNFILTHHGTSKVRYFYNTWINEHPGEKVDDALFSYPGPRPTTKETSILMMADAVEARSRSLEEFTPNAISEMVEQMVEAQIADGQFRLSPLTLKDIEDIKQVFKEKLLSMNHHRVVYPELKTED